MKPPFNGTVLVAGATGRTGRLVVRRLQAHGIDFRLFVQSGEKAMELFGPEIVDRLVIGSVLSEEEVEAAVRSIDAVICAIGGNVMNPEAPPPSAIDRDGVIRLATAAKAAGVGSFVLISSLGVTHPEHPLNKYGRVLDMKLAGEEAVRKLYGEAEFRHTILRPGGLLDGSAFRHELRFDTGDRISGSISRGDVAEAAVISLWHPKAGNKTFELIKAGEDEVAQTSLERFFEGL
ncbi:SDR family oxidoreductase [Chlorobaculum sp. 24CR]|uniref:SDR family oxidoreductase n=1 Tax=Chlorobaculum sp. 24CR TaxID=2508878 RepID=UPI00100AEDCF|nr:SDR family oxidoreductase [Chlorobaculum sp. 24CR]RXK80662.1 SDR family oxidoreductase [Chlorobaculum sp. 24CR]